MARSPLTPRHAWVLTIAAVFLTLVGLLWPVVAAVVPSDASTAPDPVKITDYSTAFKVSADGDLSATERVTTQFPYGRHGIFRFWDVADPTDSHVRLVPEDISVTLDGHSEPMELSWQQGRRYRVAKIGSADRLLDPGRHVYVIKYTIAGALAPASAGNDLSGSWTDTGKGSSFYWNVVPGGWQMDMDKTRSTITLPSKPLQQQCAAGRVTSFPCKVTVSGNQLVVGTGALPPRTPVTIRAALTTPE